MIYKQETYDILPLFSTPVLMVKDLFKGNDKLLKYLPDLDMKKNDHNSISIDKNLFLNNPMFKDLRDHCSLWVKFYADEIMKIDSKQAQIYLTQSWANSTAKSEKHHSHHHPNSIISGVYYFNNTDTNIVFLSGADALNKTPLEINRYGYHLYNGTSYTIKPESGRLLLFPSTLHHRVETSKDEILRWSLSFNTFVKGELGKSDQVTKLWLA